MFDELSGLEALRADLDGQHGTFDLGLHRDQVRAPRSPGTVLRVGNIITEQGTFTANIA